MDTDPTLFVVLVGVDDYAAFDRSAGLAPGTSHLSGARADVRAWAGALARLGVVPEHVRVLTSPVSTPADLHDHVPASALGGATAQELRAACRWLAARLAEGRGRRGLLFFAGHGATGEDGALVLCPSDCRLGRDGLVAGGLPYSGIEASFDTEGLIQLTVVVDACHASARSAGPEDRPRTLTRGALPPHVRPGQLRDAFPALMACRPEESSYEIRNGNGWNGAFSWSLLRVLSRWGLDKDGWRHSSTIAQADLIERAGQLLTALGFSQTPVYTGPRHALDLAFLEPRHKGESGRVLAGPRATGGREMFPDVYDIVDGRGTVIGYFNVTADQAMWAQGAGEAAFYWLGITDALLGLPSFSLRAHVGADPAFIGLRCSFIAPNAPFAATARNAVPTLPSWFEWRRVHADGSEVIEGNLGVAAAGTSVREVVWLGSAALAGTFTPLGPSESFRFVRLAQAMQPAFNPNGLAMARDVNRLP